jgi:hypothetical protein
MSFRPVCIAAVSALFFSVVLSPSYSQNRKRYPLPEPAVPQTLGVNIHFTDPRPGEMQRLADAGFRWIRMDFSWEGIEREKGRYDFSAYDRLLSALKAHRIRPIYILDYGNRLYEEGAPRTPEARAAFARFAAAAVKHFKSQGVLWEMWNEPNGGFWKPQANADEYAALALETGKAIREAAPDEWYIGPATSGIDLNFIEKCFKAGLLSYWDAVSVHPYRNTPPETSASEIRRLQEMIRRYAPPGKRIPVISGEWGYSEKYPGLNLEKQSRYIAREFLSNMMNGVILSIWYDWHDDGPDPNEIEHHFGTVFLNDKPKPTYRAAQTLARSLDGFRYDKRLALESPDDYCLLFSKGKENRLAVWTTLPTSHEVTLPVSAGSFRVTGYTGDVSRKTASSVGLTLTLTDAPQYVVPTGENRRLSLAADWATLPSSLTVGGEEDLRQALAPVARGDMPELAEVSQADLLLSNGDRSQRIDLKSPVSPGKERLTRAPYDGDRDEAPHRLRALLSVPGWGEVAQEALVFAKYPLRIVPLPSGEGALPVRAENPSGQPFDGRLVVTVRPEGGGAAAPLSLPLRLRRGEKDRIVEASLPEADRNRASVSFSLEEKDANGAWHPVVRTEPQTFVALPDDAIPCEALPDGDPKIDSKVDCAEVPPPPGLPAKAGRTLKITYDFDPGWKFLRLPAKGSVAEPIQGKPESLGAWVYGDDSGDVLRMRFADSTGQTFQPDGGRLDWKGWRYVSFPMDGRNAGRWGGADDGVIHYPVRLDTLLLVDAAGKASEGSLYATGFTLSLRGK